MQRKNYPTAANVELHRSLARFVTGIEQYLVSSEPIDNKFIAFWEQACTYIRLLGEGNTVKWQFHLDSYERALGRLWRTGKRC